MKWTRSKRKVLKRLQSQVDKQPAYFGHRTNLLEKELNDAISANSPSQSGGISSDEEIEGEQGTTDIEHQQREEAIEAERQAEAEEQERRERRKVRGGYNIVL